MDIDLTATWAEADHADLTGRTAVVIDVLRATSTIITALSAGAERVIPVETVDEGFATAERLGRGRVVLAGERGGLRIPGYDLGNSPLEYTTRTVGGKTVVLTTTNGTRALAHAGRADAVVICALINVSAVVGWLTTRYQAVTIVCSGTEGRLSLDDFHCGGMLVSLLMAPGYVRSLSDGARTAMGWFVSNVGTAENVLKVCHHGRRLASLGFADDVAYCAQTDLVTTVPVWEGDAIVADNPARNASSPEKGR